MSGSASHCLYPFTTDTEKANVSSRRDILKAIGMNQIENKPFLEGRTISLLRISESHRAGIRAWVTHAPDSEFEYMSYGPFKNQKDFDSWFDESLSTCERQVLCLSKDGANSIGLMSLMREDINNQVVEIGSIQFSPEIQRTVEATEALFLLINYVFENLGYRRLEWKCDINNLRSKKAASRLGFKFEGVFRQHMMVKGRNRDTAWYSIIDSDWPQLKPKFESWLKPENFIDGKQKSPLAMANS